MRRKLATLPRAQVIIDQLINLRALRGGEVTYVERHGVTDCLAVGRKLPGAFGGHAAQFVREYPSPLARAGNISAAAIYRTIKDIAPTMALDEADTYLKENEEMRGVIDSGHEREFAWVIRTAMEGEDTV